jgi:hypothetical protein
MEELGYTDIKMWYQQMNNTFISFEEYFTMYFQQPTVKALLLSVDDDKL